MYKFKQELVVLHPYKVSLSIFLLESSKTHFLCMLPLFNQVSIRGSVLKINKSEIQNLNFLRGIRIFRFFPNVNFDATKMKIILRYNLDASKIQPIYNLNATYMFRCNLDVT